MLPFRLKKEIEIHVLAKIEKSNSIYTNQCLVKYKRKNLPNILQRCFIFKFKKKNEFELLAKTNGQVQNYYTFCLSFFLNRTCFHLKLSSMIYTFADIILNLVQVALSHDEAS